MSQPQLQNHPSWLLYVALRDFRANPDFIGTMQQLFAHLNRDLLFEHTKNAASLVGEPYPDWLANHPILGECPIGVLEYLAGYRHDCMPVVSEILCDYVITEVRKMAV